MTELRGTNYLGALEIELARFGEVVRDLLLVKLLANVEEPEQRLKRYRTLQLGLIEVDNKRRDNRRMCVCVCVLLLVECLPCDCWSRCRGA